MQLPTSFVAGLRSTGIIAPLVLHGPKIGQAFRAYVEQLLAPGLSPGDLVVMDNLAAYKVAGVAEAIAATNAGRLNPPKGGSSQATNRQRQRWR